MITGNVQKAVALTRFSIFQKREKPNQRALRHWTKEELAVLRNESVVNLLFGHNDHLRNHILKYHLRGRSFQSVKAKLWRMQKQQTIS